MQVVALEQPRLRPTVEVRLNASGATVTGASGQHMLSVDESGQVALARLLDDLRAGGVTISDLAQRHPEIENLRSLLEKLDQLHLLTESDFEVPFGVISGSQLDRDVRRVAQRQQRQFATSSFHSALVDATASRRQLIGYALEYFWLVRAAPALIAPAVATAPDLSLRRELQNFLASELNHDKYLLRALKCAGLEDDLTDLQPLPTTFRICASLGAYAQQHPLSFAASLFLFEQPQPDFIEAFERRCVELDLPEGFYVPLRQHSSINDEADHGAISTDLLALIPAVMSEERTVVLRNVSVLVETMLQQELEILEYYGDPAQACPRLFR